MIKIIKNILYVMKSHASIWLFYLNKNMHDP